MDNQSWRLWLTAVLTVTVVLASALGFTQHAIREGVSNEVNEAADAAYAQLQAGQSPLESTPSYTIDLQDSTAPFAIIIDQSKRILASSARLERVTPLPPQGVFDFATTHGGNSLTWAPEKDVRLAIMVKPYAVAGNTGFIITGKSLQPAGDRIKTVSTMALAAWLAILAIATFLALAPIPALRRSSPRKKSSNKRAKR